MWQCTAAEIPIIEWLLDGNSFSPNVPEVRTGGKEAIQRHEGWEPRGILGLPDLAAMPNFAASGMGREAQSDVSQLCPGGRGGKEDPCPSQAVCFNPWKKKKVSDDAFFYCCAAPALLWRGSPASAGSSEAGAAQNLQLHLHQNPAGVCLERLIKHQG